MKIYITELRRFCHNRVVQELCNQFERQWPKQAEIALQLLQGCMWHWWFTPRLRRYGQTVPGGTRSREGTNTSNRTENRGLSNMQMSKQWIAAGPMAAFIPQVLAFSDRDVTGLSEWQIEGECVLLLKNLEFSCWVLLRINAIWLVTSEIQHVSYSEGEKKGLKTHRRRCNKPNRQPADRLTHNTEEKRNVTCVLNGQHDLNFTGEPTQCDQMKRLKRQLICALKCVIMLQHTKMQWPEKRICCLLLTVLSWAFTRLRPTWHRIVLFFCFFLYMLWVMWLESTVWRKCKNINETQSNTHYPHLYCCEKHDGAVNTQMWTPLYLITKCVCVCAQRKPDISTIKCFK